MQEKEMLKRARSLRKEMTPEERKLWYEFMRYSSFKFYKQKPMGSYILDFYCPKAKLAVELDGSQHYMSEGLEYDNRRTKYLNENGIKVLRFTNLEVKRNFDAVCESIYFEVKMRMSPLSQAAPDSSPQRGEPNPSQSSPDEYRASDSSPQRGEPCICLAPLGRGGPKDRRGGLTSTKHRNT